MFSGENPRQVGAFAPGGGLFQQYAARMEAWKGNAPGFPNEFRYLDGVEGRLNTNKEYIDIRPEGAYDIRQASEQQPIYGHYAGGQVPDTPFDQKQWNEKTDIWVLVGMGSLLVGAILYFRSRAA